MAVGGLSSSTSSSLNSIRGYGGLASGLDRDSLIEGMTAATRAKIAKQGQKKQTLQWKQDAYRGVSSKLIEFSQKYTSYAKPATNLTSASFFTSSVISALGANSSKVSISGKSTAAAAAVSIIGVKNLAKNAQASSGGAVSKKELSSGGISATNAPETFSNLEGESIQIQYGTRRYSVRLGSGTTSDGFTYDYSDPDKAIESIKKSLEAVNIGDDKSLADVIILSKDASGDKIVWGAQNNAGNTIRITGGSEHALKGLGILADGQKIGDLTEEETTISKDGGVIPNHVFDPTREETFSERIGGKSMSFTYNGVTKSITFMTNEKIMELAGNDSKKVLDIVKEDMQKKLNSAFGNNRITVELSGDGDTKNFNFKTVDNTSVLSISNGDKGILGSNGAFHMEYGLTNRLNLSTSIGASGLAHNISSISQIEINGETIQIDPNESINQLMNKINNSGIGVKISYLQSADKFSIQATNDGAGGSVNLDANAQALFGITNANITAGVDATIYVKYEGSDEIIELNRGSNTFDLNGLNVTVNGIFGRDKDGGALGDSTDAVTFSAATDTDKIISAVTSMIEDFNEMLSLVQKEVSTKPNRDYTPLTDEQKEEMTEEQIAKWEEKAKAGVLFADSTLRTLSDNMRFIFDSGSAEAIKLKEMGISTSTSYSDNGKLVIDEEKFRKALEEDPDAVAELFTRSSKKDASGNITDQGGFMSRLSTITNKYASTTGAVKGILVERAGSTYVPTSILANSLQKEMDSIDDIVDNLKDKLKIETDRYIKQFTSLETLISQMNSQSSWLSQQFG